ncbi:MAG: hypothetical protein AAF869_06095 [Pseudomonadota bacterium]
MGLSKTIAELGFTAPNPPRLQPMRAWRSLKQSHQPGGDRAALFGVGSALTGATMLNAFARFGAMGTGRMVLRETRDVGAVLGDQARLGALDEDTVGRAYLGFCTGEDASPTGLIAASMEAGLDIGGDAHPELTLFVRRLRSSYCLWRLLAGYDKDPVGELCMLSFIHAQTGHMGLGVIAISEALRRSRVGGPRVPIFRLLWEARRIGKAAAWLPAIDVEALAPRKLVEARSVLNLKPPALYRDQPEEARREFGERQDELATMSEAPQKPSMEAGEPSEAA